MMRPVCALFRQAGRRLGQGAGSREVERVVQVQDSRRQAEGFDEAGGRLVRPARGRGQHDLGARAVRCKQAGDARQIRATALVERTVEIVAYLGRISRLGVAHD